MFNINGKYIMIPATNNKNIQILRAQIILLEPMGNEIIATCRIGDCEVTARLSASSQLKPDQLYDLYFNIKKLKLFDPRSGANLNGLQEL